MVHVGSFTDYLNDAYLDLLLGGKRPAVPPVWYVGVSHAPPNRAGKVVEPADPAYRRVPVPNDPAHWVRVDSGPFAGPVKANAGPIAFPPMSVGWQPPRALFVADALVGGNVWVMADTTRISLLDPSGGPPTIAAGAFLIQMA